MKHIIFLLFLMLSASLFAQQPNDTLIISDPELKLNFRQRQAILHAKQKAEYDTEYDASLKAITAIKKAKEEIKMNRTAGDELIIFTNRMYTGMIISLTGSIVVYNSIHFIEKNPDIYTGMLIVGGITCFVGIIISIESISHIKKAGIKLNINQNGIGISIPLE